MINVNADLIVECPADKAEQTAALLKKEMEEAVSLSVPLRVSVEYGKNWGEFH